MEKKGLQVINASYSKTGTKTMHEAFDILGYKVCDAHENVYRYNLQSFKFADFNSNLSSHYDIWEKIWNGEGDVRKHFHTLYGLLLTFDINSFGRWP